MASPFQQQALQRKIVYLTLVAILFTGAWVWRRYVVQPQAQALALREEDVGEVRVVDMAVRLSLTGSRGLATCALWMTAIEKQKKNQWNELELLVRTIAKLQPHFVTPWLFQSWNLAYNVSVESDLPRDKYFYISRGIQLLADGERQNRYQPEMRRELGFYHQHKICQSDENNVFRSLFQLSLIPPINRDPGKMRSPTGGVNLEAFKQFCREHPHLIRRLHSPPLPYDPRREYPKFSCASPEEVLQFLEDNGNVPGLYAEKLEDEQLWSQGALKKNFTERFPVLPPSRDGMYDAEIWSRWTLERADKLPDETDAYAVAGAWYNYAQEALPDPDDEIAGDSKPITDRTRQRLPKHMSTAIFRSAPSRALSFVAERLQQEGWFDAEPWEVRGWFGDESVTIGGGRPWSAEAWRTANEAWKNFGRRNNLWFEDPAKEADKRRLASAFAKHFNLKEDELVPNIRAELLDEETRKQQRAYQVILEYNRYRRLTNFEHFRVRSEMELRPETITARKLFYEAEQLRVGQGKRTQALLKYEDDRALNAWRDLLTSNEEYRKDDTIQDQSMELQVKYLDLYAAVRGEQIQQQLTLQSYLGQMACPTPLGADWMVLGLHSRPNLYPPLQISGPLDIEINGKPLIDDLIRKAVKERMK